MLKKLKANIDFIENAINERTERIKMLPSEDSIFNTYEQKTMTDADGYRMRTPKANGNNVYLYPEQQWIEIQSVEDGHPLDVRATFSQWRAKNQAYNSMLIENEQKWLLMAEIRYLQEKLQQYRNAYKIDTNNFIRLEQHYKENEYRLMLPELLHKQQREIKQAIEIFNGDDDFNGNLDDLLKTL